MKTEEIMVTIDYMMFVYITIQDKQYYDGKHGRFPKAAEMGFLRHHIRELLKE